jgi:uncharacterized protein YxeA
MNSARSPAPNASLFNLPGNKKANSLFSAVNSPKNSATNAVKNVAVNSFNSVKNATTNSFNVAKNATAETFNVSQKVGGSIVQIILIILTLVVIVIFAVYWKSINKSLTDTYEYVRQAFGGKKVPIESKDINEDENTVHNKPQNPNETPRDQKSMVEKVLPGHQEVFNISKNSYTYYDAEPLCKALNAELATYEQVKQAYAQGAEWCNYGWVKGQMAVYPTQKGTFDTLQSGPENQRMSCGKPGLNGGYFDNPELRYGVNCYGVKPDQKAHDATAVASGEGAPLSPGGLEQEKKVAKYRGETNYISVLPWNKSSWSA